MNQLPRIIFGLSFASVCLLATTGPAATDCVDAVNGNDANPGNSTAPWRILTKAANTMASGDTAYVRAGTYRETLQPKSGQRFEAESSAKPLITGCEPVSGWTVHSGSIYKAAVNAKVYDVFVGTNYMHKARWPNFDGDYLDVSSWAKGNAAKVTDKYQVAFDAMTPPANMVGGWYSGIHGSLNFCPQEGRIAGVNGRQLTVTDIRENDWHWTDPKHSGVGVGYITDHLNCLDVEEEWHWQDGTLYFWAPGGGAPTNVLARTRIHGFVLQNVRNVTLKGLFFLGASVHVDGGSHNTIDGCHFRHVSPWGNAKGSARFATSWGSAEDGTAGLHVAGTNHTIQNCSLVGGWGTGIRLDGGSDLTVTNNYLADFVTLHHNVIHSLNPKTAGAGIFLHGAQHKQETIFRYHNTVWGNFNNAISSHTWGKGSISNVVFRDNHASGTGFKATAIDGVTTGQNRENVPAGEFVDVANSSFRLKKTANLSIAEGGVIARINDAEAASPYAGSAPGLGAFESGGKDWTAGSTVAPPVFP